jgi:hypothetical protein
MIRFWGTCKIFLVQGARDLQQALKEKIPGKIDIGPVYSQDPAKRAAYRGDTSASGFKPVERELVFDIDLTDYDDVRNSSSGTGMSRKCWVLMHAAIQVMLTLTVSRKCWVLMHAAIQVMLTLTVSRKCWVLMHAAIQVMLTLTAGQILAKRARSRNVHPDLHCCIRFKALTRS